jgi:hypothetical protein
LSASAPGRLAHFLSLPLFNSANFTVMANGQISDWLYPMTDLLVNNGKIKEDNH